ncbi:MAG: hypothetical protein ACXIUZ_12605 [Lysobacteraceae bacterium]
MTPAVFRAIVCGIAASFLGLAAVNLNLVGLPVAARGTALVGLVAAAVAILGDRWSRRGGGPSPTPRALWLVYGGSAICVLALLHAFVVTPRILPPA